MTVESRRLLATIFLVLLVVRVIEKGMDKPDPDEQQTAAQRAITNECDAIKTMLLEKNRAYGNSALDPVRVFSKADAAEQIRVRLDDKLSRLSRLARGSAAGEDVILDLIGYLVFLRIAEKRTAILAEYAEQDALGVVGEMSGVELDLYAETLGVFRWKREPDESLRQRCMSALKLIADVKAANDADDRRRAARGGQ